MTEIKIFITMSASKRNMEIPGENMKLSSIRKINGFQLEEMMELNLLPKMS